MQAITWLTRQIHNRGHAVKRSTTYIDDTMILGPRRLIRQWLQDCVDAAVSVWGPFAINEDKKKCWDDRLIGIGWELDFEAWRAQPKDKGANGQDALGAFRNRA